MTTMVDLTRDLLEAAPPLHAVLSEHLVDMDGEFLSHRFMADVTRWLVAHGAVPAVLAVLERHLVEGDAEVQNVVAVSFVENLAPDDSEILAALGPALRAERESQQNWTPSTGLPAT